MKKGKNYDILTDLVNYIRSPTRESFRSVRDLAVTIVQRCCTIFTSDPKLLSPSPFLLEIYRQAIGNVVCLICSHYTDTTRTIINS